MQVADIIGSVRRHWRVSVALLLLSGIALGVFLFTRKQARGEDQWQSSVLLLVPTRGKDGAIPAGVSCSATSRVRRATPVATAASATASAIASRRTCSTVGVSRVQCWIKP